MPPAKGTHAGPRTHLAQEAQLVDDVVRIHVHDECLELKGVGLQGGLPGGGSFPIQRGLS